MDRPKVYGRTDGWVGGWAGERKEMSDFLLEDIEYRVLRVWVNEVLRV